jgi:putative endonuclease
MATPKTWFVYLIECVDGSLYTGITVDLAARFAAHREGRGGHYTRSHPPLRMLAAETHADRSAASKAEHRIKQLSAAQKRAVAAGMTANPLAPTA